MKLNYLREFFAYLITAQNYSKLTAETYLDTLNIFKDFIGCRCELNEVSVEDLLDFIYHRSKNGLTGKTIAKDIAALDSFFDYLILEHVRDDNPAKHLERPRREKTLPRVLSIDEVDTFMQAIDGDKPSDLRDQALFELIYSSGLRVSEAVQLSLDDIFFDEFLGFDIF